MQVVRADIDIIPLTRELCRFATGVVAEENEALFARLQRELPFRIYRYKSGEVFNGWVVPQLWRVQQATIRRGGDQIFDGKVHTLAVAKYSTSFQGELDLETLKTHLVTNPDVPQAYVFHCMWQYRPWAPGWAFCIPYEIYKTLDAGSWRDASGRVRTSR
jgi:aminopeptidase-like protein